MIVLDWADSGTAGGRHAVALFGLGLVGSAILSAIHRNSGARGQSLAFGWLDEAAREVESAAIVACLDAIARNAGDKPLTLDIVWAAGRGGFQASTEEFSGEMAAFDAVLALTQTLATRHPEARLGFHLVSSAGGLFEGQRLVGADSVPSPQRAYGAVKLRQEALLAALPASVAVSVYRPSSIYGFKVGGRAGLISTLVVNAINNRTTRIFGDLNTLRDYVFVQDVGRFIARRLIDGDTRPPGPPRTFLLASGKPTSMHEIVREIETRLHRRLLLKFDVAPSNARHMSFRPAALPAHWQPSALAYGVHATMTEIMTTFLKPHA